MVVHHLLVWVETFQALEIHYLIDLTLMLYLLTLWVIPYHHLLIQDLHRLLLLIQVMHPPAILLPLPVSSHTWDIALNLGRVYLRWPECNLCQDVDQCQNFWTEVLNQVPLQFTAHEFILHYMGFQIPVGFMSCGTRDAKLIHCATAIWWFLYSMWVFEFYDFDIIVFGSHHGNTCHYCDCDL